MKGLPQAQSNRANQSWTGTFKTVNQSNLFLLIIWLSHEFWVTQKVWGGRYILGRGRKHGGNRGHTEERNPCCFGGCGSSSKATPILRICGYVTSHVTSHDKGESALLGSWTRAHSGSSRAQSHHWVLIRGTGGSEAETGRFCAAALKRKEGSLSWGMQGLYEPGQAELRSSLEPQGGTSPAPPGFEGYFAEL
jgi:hypothetical protein